MGFRNPLRSLPADNVTGGAFTGNYTVPGTFTVGDADAGHIVLEGATPALKLYAADGTTLLVDMEPTGPMFSGILRTGPDGRRVELGAFPGASGDTIVMYSGAASEARAPALGTGQIGFDRWDTILTGAVHATGTAAGLVPDVAARVTVRGAVWDRDTAAVTLDGGVDVDGLLNVTGGIVINGNGGDVIDNGIAWASPALLNSWTDFGAPFTAASYIRLPDGTVAVRGLIAGGSTAVNAKLFTLPAGFRPGASVVFATMAAGPALARVDVQASGDVILPNGLASNVFLSLNGIRFTAEQ